jgi:diguanylate cyclase (GGDEF)-like protein/PAS domain S-box-containing protein
MFDTDGRYLAQSSVDRETHGPLIGLLPTEARVGPDEGRVWLDLHLRTIAGEHIRYSRELDTAHGRIISETSISPVWHNGAIVGGVGISVDQTQRATAEKTLQETHKRISDFLKISSDWVWETGPDLRFSAVYGDDTRVGLDFSRWLGKTGWELQGVDPAHYPLWASLVAKAMSRQPINDFIHPLQLPDGSRRWIEMNAEPMFDDAGTFTGYRGVSRDVTDRERLNRMLRRSDLVINATGNLIVLCDVQGRIEWVNPAFSKFTGYSLDDVVGQRPSEFLEAPRTNTKAEATSEIDAALAEGREIRSQVLNRKRNGDRYWADIQVRPLFAADGSIAGSIGVQTVITDLVTAQQRLTATLDGVAAGMLRVSENGQIIECNAEACRLLGQTEEQLLGREPLDDTWMTLFADGSPRSKSDMPAAMALSSGKPMKGEIIGVRLPDGSTRWLRLNANQIVYQNTDVSEVIVSFIDVTGDEEQKRELETARSLLNDVIETIPDAIAAFDTNDRLILCNEAYRDFYALSEPEILHGATFEEILRHGVEVGQFEGVGASADEREAWLRKRMEEHRQADLAPSMHQLANGRWIQVRERLSESGVSVGVSADITALKTAEFAIRNMAETDSLTGLADRAVMMRDLSCVLSGTRGQDEGGVFALLDLDHFKSINDTLGHDGGDQLLCVIANRLRRNTRRTDVVARLGGDEFAVLIHGVSDEAVAKAVIDKLHHALTARVTINGTTLLPAVSLGVTLLPKDGASARELMKNADIALYRTKDSGRNGWTFYDVDLRRRLETRRDLAEQLQSNNANDQVDVIFEPKLELATGRIIGHEARARLFHLGEEIAPETVLAIVEESGLGLHHAELLLNRALTNISAALAAGEDPGHVAFNLTTEALRDQRFIEIVRLGLERYSVPPERLAFEITETSLLDRSVSRVSETLDGLHRLGVTLTLDDFGTGYASLTHLKHFPVSRLKIHRSFVANVDNDNGDAVIVRILIELAHHLGMTVTADGVTTDAQIDALKALGCDYMQGTRAGSPRPHLGPAAPPEGA